MSNLKYVSDKDLEKELERRRKERLKNPKPDPIPFDQVNWKAVYDSAVSDFNWQHTEDYHEDNDNDHYMSEEVMKAVYGNKVFDYLNSLHR